MNRKTLTILIAAAVILIGGIAFAVVKLYSGSPDSDLSGDSRFLETHQLVKAVPSDAAIVFCAKNFGRLCEYLGDSVSVFGELTSDRFSRIASNRYNSLKKAQAIVSVHYSKDLPPLMIIDAGKAIADTTEDFRRLMADADSSRLIARTNGDLLLISSSETIINSSIRHLEEGHSILEANGFAEITSATSGDDVIFFSNAYTDNIIGAYFAKKHRKSRNFFKELSEWTAFSITRHSDSGVTMRGALLYSNDPSYYLNILTHSGSSEVRIADAVPSNVDFILDLPIGNISSYIKAYRNHLDSRSRLDKFEATLATQKKEFGQNAEEWAKSLDIKEISIINLHFGEKLRQVLMLRPGNRQKADNVSGMKCLGFASAIFGNIFKAEEENACALVGDWIVIGAADCVSEYSKSDFIKETLAARFGTEGLDRIPQKNCGAWMYHSLSEDPNLLDATFSPMMAKGCRNILKGASYVPIVISAGTEGGKVGLDFNLDRVLVSKGSVPTSVSGRDTTINVPEGPFKVRNCATGKINTIYQNSHLSICLRDENGKDVWGVPFKSKIRGYVQEVDYYNNGKIQYLFAAGSQMYLIDRLGRFVSGFPAETGKKIAAGPAVYDFTGAKGYTAMLLHTDNTVGYYDLHGKQVPSWKGITADETIKSLPELLEGNGKKYWVVRTSAQSIVFPFNGGEPLIKGEGNKMIRPDSKIEITEKGFSAVCYDGKERTFKSGK